VESEILPAVRELGIGFVAYSPLGRGLLTGAITKPQDLGPQDSRTQRNPPYAPDALDRNLVLVDRVRAIAERKGAAPGQLALAWVLAKGDDIVPIPGTKRRKYLEENAAAADVRLTSNEIAKIEAAIPQHAVAGERYAPAGMKAIDR
jgi:aryl-alcohol dehydrogenase-like predicted oxidoreductase